MKPLTGLFKVMLALLPLVAVFAAPEAGAHTVQVDDALGLEVELVPSDNHDFAYVRAYLDGDELVLYGKIRHRHEAGRLPEGHVDVMFLDERGEAVSFLQMPVVNRGSHRKGWRGAHFRIRVAPPGPAVESLRFRAHDVTLFPETPSSRGAEAGGEP